MNAALEFANPWFLALFAVLLFLPVFLRRSLANFGRAQGVVCTLVRALLLTLVILALAGGRAMLPSSEVSVIFAVDASASISPEAAKSARDFVASTLLSQRAGDTAGIVGFARDAHVWQAPREAATLQNGRCLRMRRRRTSGMRWIFRARFSRRISRGVSCCFPMGMTPLDMHSKRRRGLRARGSRCGRCLCAILRSRRCWSSASKFLRD